MIGIKGVFHAGYFVSKAVIHSTDDNQGNLTVKLFSNEVKSKCHRIILNHIVSLPIRYLSDKNESYRIMK
jgi:hypothetical protein